MDSDAGRVDSAAEQMTRQMALQMQRFRVTQMAGRAATEYTKEHLNPARESSKHREVQLLRVRTCIPCRLSKLSAKLFYTLLFVTSTAPVPHPCITHIVPHCVLLDPFSRYFLP